LYQSTECQRHVKTQNQLSMQIEIKEFGTWQTALTKPLYSIAR